MPAAVQTATFAPAQRTADEASRKRQIDYFNLHAAPVGMRLGRGADAGYVLSYLGTAKERTDLNVELRALAAPGQLGFSLNYSGPVTLAAQAPSRPTLGAGRGSGVSFEVVWGVPGNGVADAYVDYLERWGERPDPLRRPPGW